MEHPKQFSTYLGANIDGEIRHYLRDRAQIVKFPRRYQEISSKAKTVRKVLAEMPMSDRTRSEFAARYNCDLSVVKVEEWVSVLWVHIPGKVSRFASKKQRPVSDVEVAREMRLSVAELQEAERAIANRRTGSLSPEAENIPQLVECPHKREQQEEWGELYFALERLPEGDRYLLHQHYFEGVPLSKLAKGEGVSVEGIKDRIKGAIGRAR
jgi:RNA polymerase sigma factor (sigma-70 family)